MKSLLTVAILTLCVLTCRGQVWELSNGLGTDSYGIQVRHDTIVVCGPNILSVSYDNGENWTEIIAGLPQWPVVRDVLWVKNRLFVTILYQGIWVSDDLGQTWQLFDGTSILNNGPTELASDGTSLFVADVNGFLWKSPLNTPILTKVLTVNGAVTGIWAGNGKVYAATSAKGVYYSGNHGATFSNISTGLPKVSSDIYYEVQTIASNGNGDVYCGVNNNGVYKLDASTSTWQAKNTGIEEVANSIGTSYRGLFAFDNTVLIGTGNGNVYLSTDKAETFSNLSEGEFVPTYKIALSSSKILVTKISVRYRTYEGLFEYTDSKAPPAPRDFKVYPNPSQGSVEVQINNFPQATGIDVIDCFGKTVLARPINDDRVFSLDMSKLSKGFYVIRVLMDGNIIASQKIIKME